MPALGILLAICISVPLWALVLLLGAMVGNAAWVLLRGAADADAGGWLFMVAGAALVVWRMRG